MSKQTPAEVVIELFGIRPLAGELSCSPTTILRWRDDPNGLVPSRWHGKLLELAKRQKVSLSPDMLVRGRGA